SASLVAAPPGAASQLSERPVGGLRDGGPGAAPVAERLVLPGMDRLLPGERLRLAASGQGAGPGGGGLVGGRIDPEAGKRILDLFFGTPQTPGLLRRWLGDFWGAQLAPDWFLEGAGLDQYLLPYEDDPGTVLTPAPEAQGNAGRPDLLWAAGL